MSGFGQLMMKNKYKYKLNPLITIVGSPTITNDFIYKNVNMYNYIYINELLPLSTANSWKIKFKLKYARNYSDAVTSFIGYYGNNSDSGKSPALRTDNYPYANTLRCLISKVGYSNWNINIDYAYYYLTVNQQYYFEFGFSGTQYYVKDLISNTTLWSKSSSDKCECSNYISLLHSGWNGGCEFCPGEMDLKTFEIYINDNLYFSAIV